MILALGAIVGCSALPAVQAVERSPSATTSVPPIPTTVSSVDPWDDFSTLVDDVDPTALLLQSDDVPGWAYTQPAEIPASTMRLAVDCERMDVLFRALSMPATEVAGEFLGTTFTERVVEFDDSTYAWWLSSAVDDLPVYCRAFNDVEGRWTARRVDDVDTWGSAVSLNRQAVHHYFVVWPMGSRAVMLQLTGPAAAENVGRLVAAAEARIEGRGAVPAGPVPPTPTTTTTWPQEPPPDTRPVGQGPLDAFVIEPGDIGPGWQYAQIWPIEAVPADPDNPLCGAVYPEQPPGISAFFEHDSGAGLSQSVLGGTPEQLELLIQADIALDGCQIYPPESGTAMTAIAHATPAGADSSSLIFFNRGPVNRGESVSTVMFAQARFGSTLVLFTWDGENDTDPTTPSPTPEVMLKLLAAAAP